MPERRAILSWAHLCSMRVGLLHAWLKRLSLPAVCRISFLLRWGQYCAQAWLLERDIDQLGLLCMQESWSVSRWQHHLTNDSLRWRLWWNLVFALSTRILEIGLIQMHRVQLANRWDHRVHSQFISATACYFYLNQSLTHASGCKQTQDDCLL